MILIVKQMGLLLDIPLAGTMCIKEYYHTLIKESQPQYTKYLSHILVESVHKCPYIPNIDPIK